MLRAVTGSVWNNLWRDQLNLSLGTNSKRKEHVPYCLSFPQFYSEVTLYIHLCWLCPGTSEMSELMYIGTNLHLYTCSATWKIQGQNRNYAWNIVISFDIYVVLSCIQSTFLSLFGCRSCNTSANHSSFIIPILQTGDRGSVGVDCLLPLNSSELIAEARFDWGLADLQLILLAIYYASPQCNVCIAGIVLQAIDLQIQKQQLLCLALWKTLLWNSLYMWSKFPIGVLSSLPFPLLTIFLSKFCCLATWCEGQGTLQKEGEWHR